MRKKLVTREKIISHVMFKALNIESEMIYTDTIDFKDSVSVEDAKKTLSKLLTDKGDCLLDVINIEQEKKRYALDEETYLAYAWEIEPIKRKAKEENKGENE